MYVAIFSDFKVRRGDNLGSFPKPRNVRLRFAFNADSKTDTLALPRLFGLQTLDKLGRDCLGCTSHTIEFLVSIITPRDSDYLMYFIKENKN